MTVHSARFFMAFLRLGEGKNKNYSPPQNNATGFNKYLIFIASCEFLIYTKLT